ncbi:hypothetical protein [Jongsikchunia kroppenstedtii]|uniref:hypothetical protein n=1 Tax=Jongsikchunia kroppenstedtii TaxID=1121721 RepID=UPI0004779565|nr:hypothetical protein [Jongsikchunia kroppenstedtii]
MTHAQGMKDALAALEQLMTLDGAMVLRAGGDPELLARLAGYAVDEAIELWDDAEARWEHGDEDAARYCEQEASAWSATAQILRELAAAESAARSRIAERSA